jgi:hypothetical protein
MEFKIELLSEDKDFAMVQTRFLKDWLANEEGLSEAKVSEELAPIQKGEAGAEILTILQVVLSSALIGELSRVIQVWLQERSKRIEARSPELKMSVTKPDGTRIEIDTNKGEDVASLLQKLS